MKNILIGIDFSDSTGKVINMGIKLAKAFGSGVLLAHTEPPNSGYIAYELNAGIYDGLSGYFSTISRENQNRHNEIIKNARQSLEALKKEFSNHNINAETLLLEGDTAKELVRIAEDRNIDLIIIGNHQHGRFYNYICNDVGQNIICHSPSNVLVVETVKKK